MSLVAVAMLFWVSFWLISRLDHKRWLEFVKARVWSAVAVGSTMSLVLIGFTAVYREGFETALFYQALLSFGTGLTGYIALGFGLGVVALTVVSFFIFRLGRKLPDAHLPQRGRRARDADVGRLPRQRRPRAAGRRHDRLHRARLAAPADLPGPGHRLLAHRADRDRPARAAGGLRARGDLHVRDQAPTRAGRVTAHRAPGGHRPDDRPRIGPGNRRDRRAGPPGRAAARDRERPCRGRAAAAPGA